MVSTVEKLRQTIKSLPMNTKACARAGLDPEFGIRKEVRADVKRILTWNSPVPGTTMRFWFHVSF